MDLDDLSFLDGNLSTLVRRRKSFSSFVAVESIKSRLSEFPPHVTGTCPVSLEQLTVFHGVDSSNVSKINLANATPEELGKLADACQPIKFDVDEVHDASDCGAGEIHFGNFATLLDVANIGLVDIVQREMLNRSDKRKIINAEAYKLNVYGKEAFLQPHRDTTRNETVFASLVVVFPTSFEGGEFIFCDKGNDWIVDVVKLISEAGKQPCIGYAAFLTSVEHGVLKIRSGHLITLTYNLFFVPDDHHTPYVSTPTPGQKPLAQALYTLMSNPTVLPEGGYLAVGLNHRYPIVRGMDTNELQEHLKGTDAMLARILSTLGVSWAISVFYPDVGTRFYQTAYLHTKIIEFDGLVETFDEEMGSDAEVVDHTSLTATGDVSEEVRQIARVTKAASSTYTQSSFIAGYGGVVEPRQLYGDVCFIVDLPSVAERAVRNPSLG